MSFFVIVSVVVYLGMSLGGYRALRSTGAASHCDILAARRPGAGGAERALLCLPSRFILRAFPSGVLGVAHGLDATR